MVPETATVCGADDTVGPDKLYVTDYSQIVSMSAMPTASLTRALGAVVASPPVSGVGSGTQTINVDTVDLDGLGGGPDFAVGAGVILADRNGATTGASSNG